MFQLLKHILLFFYFLFVRSAKRERLLKRLIPGFKKRKLDLPFIPAALDDIAQLPKGWHDWTSFVGFNKDGVCFKLTGERTHETVQSLQIVLDIPGVGCFSHKENVSNQNRDSEDVLFEGSSIILTCLQPMKRWKVNFRGPLTRHDSGKRAHATISLYWQCLFDPYDHFVTPSSWELAKNMSSLGWGQIFSFAMLDSRISYEQWGELRGRISIEEFEEISVRFRSVRDRTIAPGKSDMLVRKFRQQFVVISSGLSFSNITIWLRNKCFNSSYASFALGDSVSSRMLNINKNAAIQATGEVIFPITISTCNRQYDVSENLSRVCFNDPMSSFRYSTLTINNKMAFGVCYSLETDPSSSKSKRDNFTQSYNDSKNLAIDHASEVTTLDGHICKIRSLVGGKAYNLSFLRSLKTFNVPNGICLPTTAFEKFINDNKDLCKAISNINECVKSCQYSTLQNTCDIAVKAFLEAKPHKAMQNLIKTYLGNIFGTWETMRFAVRSSSIGEDSLESSAAGQMDTYLSVQGFENILSAVQRCWASSVSYQVVEYRRQSGQVPIESMCVIIQEMVDADISGVMFTADPVTGNTSNLVINANYGLGESVVSGTVGPDTIVLRRKDENILKVENCQVGSKEHKMVTGEVSGTVLQTNSLSAKSNLCIDEEDLLRLSRKGLEIENCFGSPQDVEWAMTKGNLYILQSRPISINDAETDKDLIHEFDSPVSSERLLVTPCNIEEMMPGVMSTLTGDLFISAVDKGCTYNVCSRLGLENPVHSLTSVFNVTGLPFLAMTCWALHDINRIAGEKAKPNVEIGVFGQPIDEHTIEDIKEYYGRNISLWTRLQRFIHGHFVLDRRDSNLYSSLINTIETMSIGKESETPQDLYKCIDENMYLYFEMWKEYIFKGVANVSAYGSVLSILSWNSSGVGLEHLSDTALILEDCQNLISGEIPRYIHSLAQQIAKSEIKAEFMNIPIDNCDSLLRQSTSIELRNAYINFLERHGHRGVREADFMDKPWSTDPIPLLKTLRLIINEGNFQKKQKKHRTVSEVIDSLQTKVNFFQRLLLKLYFIQHAVDANIDRELGKSATIKMTDIFRQAYYRLADMMVGESRLPDPGLIFFLTHREIGQLLVCRSTKLVRLSKRRKRLLPIKIQFEYPKVNFGVPQSIEENEHTQEQPSSAMLYGMPVCQGRAEGRACVIKSIEEAQQIQDGDILICKFTDVGWSPYYPLLRGLVTEMGGLLSHGAIVAREYGIPCIANTASATSFAKTGDIVILDATAGIVYRK